MIALLSAVGILCFIGALSDMLGDFNGEYYWKHYNGEIPETALPVGSNLRGEVVYIGLVHIDVMVIPAEIVPGQNHILYSIDQNLFTATEHLRIFCVRDPQLFKWIQISESSYKYFWAKHIIEAGRYKNGSFPYLIGRAMVPNRATTVGKVFVAKNVFGYNYRNINGSIVHLTDGFEVLSYSSELFCSTYKPYNRMVDPGDAVNGVIA